MGSLDERCGFCGRYPNGRTEAASEVRDWLTRERLKLGTDITPEIAAIIERCAEDLE